MIADQCQHDGGLVIGIKIRPVHHHHDGASLTDNLRHPANQNFIDIDGWVGEKPVHVLHRMLEIRFSCTCPDHASMCKHVAAVLYDVGARLDVQPELLFRLRAVNERDLIAQIDSAMPLATTASSSGKLLETDDLTALFGLELAGSDIQPELAGNPKRGAEVGIAATKSPQTSRHPAVPKKKSKRRRKTAA
jgi:uncharacterized Zn finger protein